MKLPKKDINTRGVTITSKALSKLREHPLTEKIDVFFKKAKFDPSTICDRWIDDWQ